MTQTSSEPPERRGPPFEPRLGDLTRQLVRLGRSKLWVQIVLAMALGVLLGLGLSRGGAALLSPARAEVVMGWIVLPGHIFLALIQMIVVPLVVSSIILGITSSESTTYLRTIGLRVAVYFVATTTLAITIGLVLGLIVRPGQFIEAGLLEQTLGRVAPGAAGAPAPTSPGLHKQILGLIPSNPLGAALDQSMLQLVVFAVMVGVAAMKLAKEQARPVIQLASATQQISMEIVGWAMTLAPLAVFGLIAQISMKVGLSAVVGLSAYMGTVLAGLAVLMLAYVLIVRVAGGLAPQVFLRSVREVQLLAFSTSSSAAVMPLSIQTARNRLAVSPAVARFIVPLGATINMDGTALYQVVATVFLTQVFGVELAPGALVLLITTTLGASIGSPSTPGVGIVILATILQGVGVPASGVALIIGVDRILDMARTAVNVTGDLAACVVMDRLLSPPAEGTEPAEG